MENLLTSSENSWVWLALGNAIVYAAVIIGDKLVLSKTKMSLGGFLLFVGLAQGLISLCILLFIGVPSASPQAVAASFFGGFIWSMALMLFFIVLRHEEVSRVTPVYGSSPVFATLFALLFLDEQITIFGWLGVMLVVVGTVAISIRLGKGNALTANWSLLLVLIGAAMIGGAQNLLKVSSEELPVWENLVLRNFGLTAGMLIIGTRPSSIKNLWSFLSKGRTRYRIGLIGSETIAPFTGNLLLLAALATGPVSLVSALVGARPVFVLAFAVILAVIAKSMLPDSMAKSDILLKIVGTAAIVGGVAIIAVWSLPT